MTAFHSAERVATLIIPHDRRTAMYFAGGTHANRLDLAPNNLLHWRTILRCRELGMARYDFISNKGSPGRFKATFNPNECAKCIHWERSHNWLVAQAKASFERRSRSSRRIPLGKATDE